MDETNNTITRLMELRMMYLPHSKGYETITDAIVRLNQKENGKKLVRKEIEGGGSTWWYVCEECHTAVDSGDQYCRHCGGLFIS